MIEWVKGLVKSVVSESKSVVEADPAMEDALSEWAMVVVDFIMSDSIKILSTTPTTPDTFKKTKVDDNWRPNRAVQSRDK